MARLLVAAAVSVWTLATPLAQGAPVNLVALLETYAAGQHDAAIGQAAAIKDLGPLRLQFVQLTPGWAGTDAGRRAAVAGFLAELAAARLEDDWGRLSDLIEWTCAQILRTGPPTEFERRWHMATTALAGRARVRVWLLGPYARLPHQKPLTRPPSKDDPPSPRHLLHALERFPDDPHFRLARVVAWTWGRDSEPMRNMRADWVRNAQRWAAARPAQLEAVTAFEPLTRVPDVAAEAWLRTGLIHVTVSDHAAALAAFEAALPRATSSSLTYLAHFLAGRSLEALQRPDEAMARYRRALDVLPSAESATIALASLLFARGEAESSIAMIDRRFAANDPATDPGRLIGYGAYLQWPEIKAAMRAELGR